MQPDGAGQYAVGRVLDRRPSLVGADATVGEVARQMFADGVDAVAVIDRTGRPVGMITGSDLVWLMATTQDAAPQIEEAQPEAEPTE